MQPYDPYNPDSSTEPYSLLNDYSAPTQPPFKLPDELPPPPRRSSHISLRTLVLTLSITAISLLISISGVGHLLSGRWLWESATTASSRSSFTASSIQPTAPPSAIPATALPTACTTNPQNASVAPHNLDLYDLTIPAGIAVTYVPTQEITADTIAQQPLQLCWQKHSSDDLVAAIKATIGNNWASTMDSFCQSALYCWKKADATPADYSFTRYLRLQSNAPHDTGADLTLAFTVISGSGNFSAAMPLRLDPQAKEDDFGLISSTLFKTLYATTYALPNPSLTYAATQLYQVKDNCGNGTQPAYTNSKAAGDAFPVQGLICTRTNEALYGKIQCGQIPVTWIVWPSVFWQ